MGERVVVVIVTFERAPPLRRCLDAVLAQARPPDLVVAVDNASRDGTHALLRGKFPQVKAVFLPENVGSAGGFARGMSAALAEGADWVWLMDDDVTPDASCLGELLEVAAAAKRVVVPRRRTPDGRDCGNEAVLVEAAQRLDVVIEDPDNVVFQWSHDEFVYSRLRDHVPDHVAWLLRYHSITRARSGEPPTPGASSS